MLVADLTSDGLLAQGMKDLLIDGASHPDLPGGNVQVFAPSEDGMSEFGESPWVEAGSGADAVLVLTTIDPAKGAWHLGWAEEVVVSVTAGRSSAERVSSTAVLLRAAGISVRSGVLLGADARGRVDRSSPTGCPTGGAAGGRRRHSFMTRSVEHVAGSPPIPELSPELARDWGLLAGPNERSMRKRIGWVWGLLFFSVMTYTSVSTNLIPLPSHVGKVLPELALGAALVLALTANKRLLLRPNILLLLFTATCLCAAIMSFRGYLGLGSIFRWARFATYVGVLWLTTPWWGRRRLHDPQLSTSGTHGRHRHRPSRNGDLAYQSLRQRGRWTVGRNHRPIPPAGVVRYAAVLVGMTVVLWLAGASRSKWTGVVIAAGSVVLLLTHSRVALVAMLLGSSSAVRVCSSVVSEFGGPSWWRSSYSGSELSVLLRS